MEKEVYLYYNHLKWVKKICSSDQKRFLKTTGLRGKGLKIFLFLFYLSLLGRDLKKTCNKYVEIYLLFMVVLNDFVQQNVKHN